MCYYSASGSKVEYCDDRVCLSACIYPQLHVVGSRVVSMLDSDAWVQIGCQVIVLGKLFTTIVPRFTKQRNW